MKFTPAQERLLIALFEAPSGGLPGGDLAVASGYKGRSASPYGGACRAPMWTGRVLANMPEGLVAAHRKGPSVRYALTHTGFAVAARLYHERETDGAKV